MTGIGLIFLILAVVALLAGLYFVAWCLCSVQRGRKEGHYILETSDDDHDHEYSKKLYTGLDMVDEAKETYVKNPMDLDCSSEKHHESLELEPSAPQDASDSPDLASTDLDHHEEEDDDEDRLPPV